VTDETLCELARIAAFDRDDVRVGFDQVPYVVDVDLDLLAGQTLDADIRTDDGNVTIDLEKGFSLSFHASADDVDYIRADLEDIQNFREDRVSKSGRIGGGEGRLKIHTADGDITIKENF
jgi:hypothetical protein